MKFRMLSGAAAVLALIPGISLAQFNYTAIDLEFVDVDFSVGPFSIDGDGLAVSGSFEITDSFFIGGSYEDYDFDFNIDGEVLEIGGGYFHNLDEGLDFVATLKLVDAEVSSGNQSADDDALAIGGGVRYAISPDFQIDAMLEFVDFDEGDSDTGIEIRGRYYFSDSFAVGAQIDLSKDIETFRIGARFEF